MTVTCAIIEKDGKVLVVQRSSSHKFPNKWEFPGGKLEPGESLHQCIKREISEELILEIDVIEELASVPIGTIGTLTPFRCVIRSGTLTLTEHQALAWHQPEDLLEIDFSPADIPIVKQYVRRGKRKPE